MSVVEVDWRCRPRRHWDWFAQFTQHRPSNLVFVLLVILLYVLVSANNERISGGKSHGHRLTQSMTPVSSVTNVSYVHRLTACMGNQGWPPRLQFTQFLSSVKKETNKERKRDRYTKNITHSDVRHRDKHSEPTENRAEEKDQWNWKETNKK